MSVKVVRNKKGFEQFMKSDEVKKIVNDAADDLKPKLDSALDNIRSIQRAHDEARGENRELNELSTSVEKNLIGADGKRAAAHINVEGLTVMDIMRQTVQRAVHEAIPGAKTKGKGGEES